MKYSHFFVKTNKGAKEFDSINATLLMKGSFIHQTMAGVYTFLPLGLRVLNKIENIVRTEMDAIGSELLMPALSPKEYWQKTKRLETIDVIFEARGGNKLSREKNDATYILNSTHEDVITPVVQHYKPSYKDLPCAVYQIQTKFRNEPRPKSGLLRGREFRMKDLYSFHASEADLNAFYEKMQAVYMATFQRLGLGEDTHLGLASAGAFSSGFAHEFQTLCETGEDTLFYDEAENIYYNKEIASEELKKRAQPVRASEVGNIYRLGTKYSDAFGYRVTDETGEQIPVYMGSYGLGTSRVMGVMVEKFHDERGIIWPEAVAPFQVHLIGLKLDDAAVRERAENLYKTLQGEGIDVLYDDRLSASAGEKLADADIIGIPWRLVVSPKSGEQVEVKQRQAEKAQLAAPTEAVQSVTQKKV